MKIKRTSLLYRYAIMFLVNKKEHPTTACGVFGYVLLQTLCNIMIAATSFIILLLLGSAVLYGPILIASPSMSKHGIYEAFVGLCIALAIGLALWLFSLVCRRIEVE